MEHRTKGWYPDPTNLGGLRWWDRGWTQYVGWAGRWFVDDMPLERVRAAANAQDGLVVRSYLRDALARGVLVPSMEERLQADVTSLLGAPAPSAAVTATSTAPPPDPIPSRTPTPVAPVTRPTAAPATAAPSRPAPATARPHPLAPPMARPEPPRTPPHEPVAPTVPVETWWSRTRTTLRSDLAIHGLAYLGVLLLFAGVFGLIAFSFGDVARGWRLVALVAAPSAFFLAGWYLGRRGAGAVSAALVVLGAAVLPVAAVASVTDGASPDVTGTALPITQAVLCAVIAVGELRLLRRVPVLRWTAMPTLWLGAGLLLGVTRDPVPSGEAVVRADAMQVAAIVVAIALSLVVLHRRTSDLARATTMLGMPLAAALAVVEALVASTEGWPALSGVLVAVAAVAIVECTPRRGAWIAPVQSAFLAVAALRLSTEVRPAWLGLGLAVAATLLTEWTGRRRVPPCTVHVPLMAVGVGCAVSIAEPAPGFVAMALLTAWATWRRLDAPQWLPLRDPYGVMAGIGSVGMAAMVWTWSTPSVALVTAAASVLAVSLLARAVPAVGRDAMVQWWAPTAAVATAVASVAQPWNESRTTMVVAAVVAALAGCSLVLSRLPIAARVWGATLAASWSLVMIGELASIPMSTESMVLAAMAAVAVMAGALVDRAATAHLAAIGHLAALAAIALAARPGVAMTVTVGLFAATWWALAALHEWRRVAHFERLVGALDDVGSDLAAFGAARTAPVLLAMAGTVALAMLQIPSSSPWLSTPIAVAGVVLAAATFLPWRRASVRVLAWAAFVVAVVGVLVPVAGEVARWPSIASFGLAFATMVLIAPRHTVFAWSAWAVTAPLLVQLAEAAGLSRRWSDVALAAWGATLLLAATVVDRVRHGRARHDRWVRSEVLMPPASLGGGAFLLGGAGALLLEPQWGWVLLGMAVVTMTVAVLRPEPLVAVPAMSAALVALLRLAPWVLDHPWSLAVLAALSAVVAWSLERTDRSLRDRWDVAPLVTAHAAASVGLVAAPLYGSVTVTYLLHAGVAAAAAVALRRTRWVGGYALGSVTLVIITAAWNGPGWLSLACLVLGIATTVAALLRPTPPPNPVREALLGVGALCIGASWASFVVWAELSLRTVFVSTAAACSTLLLVAAVAIRRHVRPHDLFVVWSAAAGAGLLAAAAMAGQPDVGPTVARWTFAAIAASVATAAGLVARELHPALRWASVASWLSALVLARSASGLDHTVTVVVATVIASTLALVAVPWHAMRPRSPWVAPVMALMVAVQCVGASFIDPSHTTAVAVVLLVAALQSASVAVVSGERYVFLVPPVFALAAWLVVAADALRGEPNWFTAPVGLAVLVEVALVRWIRRARPGSTYSTEVNGALVALETVAMSVMVGPMLTRIVTLHLWYAVPSVVVGVAFTVWGAATRARRRAAFGVGTVGLAVTLLIGVPIARVVPNLSGPALWLTIAGMGLVAIVVATMLERGRTHVRRWANALDEMTHDWERLDQADTAPRPGSGVETPTEPPVTSGA